VLVDGTTGDLGPGLTLERVTAGGTVLQSSVPIAGGSGDSRSLRWINGTTAVATEFVRVANAACGSLCSAVDQYSVRYYETSGAMVRFNNNATQVTVLQIQNPSSYTINGEVYFWSAGRVLLGTSPFQLTGKGQTVVNTATIAPGERPPHARPRRALRRPERDRGGARAGDRLLVQLRDGRPARLAVRQARARTLVQP
jgi:hypothetical protein